MSSALSEFVDRMPLIDHHAHGPFRADGNEARFQNALNEGNPNPLRNPGEVYQSQLGFAVARWCAPLLDLPVHADPADYWRRRDELGEREVTARLTRAAGVSDWLVDTGFRSTDFMGVDEVAEVSGGSAHEIVRIETVAETVIERLGRPADYADAFGQAIAEVAATAVGAKSVLAYRGGFAQDLRRPTDKAVAEAARRWSQAVANGATVRLEDPVLLSFGIHTALDAGLPLQFHVGFGDHDVNMIASNPLHLMDFLRDLGPDAGPIMLLHNYPYEREAGYLAHAFDNVYLDVGLAIDFLGVRATAIVARSLETAPFSRILYSSDAYGPAELHYLGARLWRNGIADVIGGWVDAGDWSERNARRVIEDIAHRNARRVYRLGDE